jgi:glycosyltransferase involved in cell wall biosynthesis
VKLSLYTGVKDGLFYDFHVEAMLRHHAPLFDEIIVNEGYSTDGTYEAITTIHPNIQVHRFEWDRSDPAAWHRHFKNQARRLCTGEWCVLLDCDEFIPEWEFPRLRQYLETVDKPIVQVRFIHFYANYRVFMAQLPRIVPDSGRRIHRNLPNIEVWGDGANVRVIDGNEAETVASDTAFEVHHFGSVRQAARLRQKWRTQARQHNEQNPRWDKLPSFVFDMFPHRWDDPDCVPDLAIYDGRQMQIVRDHPDEFVRDSFAIYEQLRHRSVSKERAR